MALGMGSGGPGWLPSPSSRPCSPPEPESNLLAIVLGVVVAVVAVIVIIAGYVLWKSKSGKALGPARQRGAGGRQDLGGREGLRAGAAALWGAPEPGGEVWWMLTPLSLCREEEQGLQHGAK